VTTRTCVRCGRPLDIVRHRDVELDHCQHCGGTFLDAGEGAQLFGGVLSDEKWLFSRIAIHSGPSDIRCPKDDGVMFKVRVAHEEQEILIEICDSCGGVWLDPGEGFKLRETLLQAAQATRSTSKNGVSFRSFSTYLFQLLSGFPLEVWNPVHRLPRATLALIAIMTFLFALQTLLPDPLAARLLNFMAMFPNQIRNGKALWTLLTNTFFHIGLLHLLGNLYFLYTFGDNVEDSIGARRFMLVYTGSAIAGSLLQALLQPTPEYPVLGASGAISGILGAYVILFRPVKLYQVVLFLRVRLSVILYAAIWFGINLLLMLDPETHIGVFAHAGGFLSGLIFGWRYRLKPLYERFANPT
jgi:membrane associated rhomboid family serine protease